MTLPRGSASGCDLALLEPALNGAVMRIGLAGVGRIGAFHAETLRALPRSTSSSSPTSTRGGPSRSRTELRAGLRPTRRRPCSPRRRRARHRGSDQRARAPAPAGRRRGGHPDVLREAGRRRRLAETPRARRARAAARTCPVHIGFQRRFDAGYRAAAGRGRSRRARLPAHAAGQRPATRHRRTRHTSRPAGGSSATATSTTSTSSGSSPGARSSRSTPRGPTRAQSFFAEAGDVDTGSRHPHPRRRHARPGVLVALQRAGPRRAAGGPGQQGQRRRRPRRLPGAALRRSRASTFPPGPVHVSFMDRFLPAYRAELTAFADVARGAIPSPCTVADALAGVPDRRGLRARPVARAAWSASTRWRRCERRTGGGTARGPPPGRAARRRGPDLLGRLRGARAGAGSSTPRRC